MTPSKTFDLIKPYLLEQKKLLLAGLAGILLVNVLQLLIPQVIKNAVDALTVLQAHRGDLPVYGMQVLLLGLSIAALKYLWQVALIGASLRVEEGLRNRIFFHLQTLSPAYFDKVTTGDLMARATNDLRNIRTAIGSGIATAIDALFMAAAFFFMAHINLRLTLLALAPAPVVIVGTHLYSRQLHRIYSAALKDFSTLTETVRERFSGIRIIKAHGSEDREAQKVEDASRRYVQSNVALARIRGLFYPMTLLCTNLSTAVILYFGGRETILGGITPGDFAAFISYMGLLTYPMTALGWISGMIQQGKASTERVQEILEARPAVPDGKASLPRRSHGIEFARVYFTYPLGKTPALKEIDLSIPPGSMLGIVGPPGSGKTALFSLVSRLYDVTDGAILAGERTSVP